MKKHILPFLIGFSAVILFAWVSGYDDFFVRSVDASCLYTISLLAGILAVVIRGIYLDLSCK